MYHLMKLELQKHKIGWFVKGAILSNIIILALLYFFTIIEKIENEILFRTTTDFFTISGILIRATFIIFAAVLISKFIIDEFKNRTSLVMFSYPIDRKKIMMSKLLLIFILTFCSMLISTCFVVLSFIGLNEMFQLSVNLNFSAQSILPELMSMMMFNLVAAGASLVPLYFGMLKYSTPATIVSAIIIALVTNSSYGPEYSLINLLYMPLGLAIIAILIIGLALRNINRLELN
ncbi:ABC transporter permease [Alkalicoccobacillus porphyridii]|uniref:ABC transporter permease n=1 Tax=Alkalicoccobacillus porphyridii TaxID=2597270 RepID=A0A554A292_9BACI|nr:ABC transporter permease [Alkalicoccobacillus porphyridii]TSB47803.1 ABC transporter permease [Alkalicoccobacillus porphyridii]